MTMVWSSEYGAVDGDFADVSLLLKGEGTDGSTTIVDSSSSSKSVAALNGAQISTAQSKFGGSSIAFDGINDYLSSVSSDFAVGTGDFTAEAFFYLNSFNNFNTIVGTRKGAISSTTGWTIGCIGTPGGQFNNYTPYFYTNSLVQGVANLLSLNTWYHLAVSREGSTVRLFLDGTIIGTGSNTQNLTDDVLFVGAQQNVSTTIDEPLNGYIDDLRITKGVARYTSNFTPPTAPLPILSPSGRITIADDSLDADARQYIINVEEQDGQALEPGVRTAINDFVVGCKSDGIWNAIKASCLLSGARTLEGALVPLKGSAPTNNGPFDAADYDRKTGLLGNGSTKYLDSNRSDSADPQNNIHISTWVSALNGGGGLIGTGGGQTPGATHLFADANNNWRFVGRCRSTSNSQISSVTNNYIGFAGISRSIANSFDTRALGSTINSSIASQAATGLNHTVFRRAGSNGFNGRLAFYSIGESLDLAKLDTRVTDLITAIGAAIP